MIYSRLLAIAFAFFVCRCCLAAGVHSPSSCDRGRDAVGTVDDAVTG